MAFEMTKKFEGLRLVAYPDPASATGTPWTIAWGHTSGVCKGDTCTQDQADFWIISDMAVAGAAVNDLCKVPLNANQREALQDFIFNIGRTKFATSNMLKLINANKLDQVGAEFLQWRLAAGKVNQGIINRRIAEQALFDKPVVAV